jgi:hypothetical protein
LDERYRLMAEVQYGGGLRLKELARLRVKDVDLERRQITIRQGKGDLDRVTVLPEALVEKMRGHLVAARRLHEADREAGHPGVAIPGALGKKFSKAGQRWEWFWLFPAPDLSTDPETGVQRRHHIHPGCYTNALSRAVAEAGIAKRVTLACVSLMLAASQPISWRLARTCGRSKSCSVMRTSRLPKSTPTCPKVSEAQACAVRLISKRGYGSGAIRFAAAECLGLPQPVDPHFQRGFFHRLAQPSLAYPAGDRAGRTTGVQGRAVAEDASLCKRPWKQTERQMLANSATFSA